MSSSSAITMATLSPLARAATSSVEESVVAGIMGVCVALGITDGNEGAGGRGRCLFGRGSL